MMDADLTIGLPLGVGEVRPDEKKVPALKPGGGDLGGDDPHSPTVAVLLIL